MKVIKANLAELLIALLAHQIRWLISTLDAGSVGGIRNPGVWDLVVHNWR
jgi:hypothetical protein